MKRNVIISTSFILACSLSLFGGWKLKSHFINLRNSQVLELGDSFVQNTLSKNNEDAYKLMTKEYRDIFSISDFIDQESALNYGSLKSGLSTVFNDGDNFLYIHQFNNGDNVAERILTITIVEQDKQFRISNISTN